MCDWELPLNAAIIIHSAGAKISSEAFEVFYFQYWQTYLFFLYSVMENMAENDLFCVLCGCVEKGALPL